MTFEVIDTHAHLDDMQDLGAAIERARESGVIAIVAVGIDYESNNRVLEIAEKFPGLVLPAFGMHPQDIGDSSEIERNLRFIEDHVRESVAIGEVGLDYHKKALGRASKDVQKQVLRDTLEIAKRFGKPASVHSRYSWRDSLEAVAESGVDRAVFHWYTGPMNVLRDCFERGYSASATLATEYHEEHRRAIKETPWDRLMLETDSPVVYRWGTEFAHPSEPADTARVVLEAVARLREVEPAFVARKTTENARRFFGLAKG